MKRWFYIGIVLLVAVLVGCNTPPPVGHPLSEGDVLPHVMCQELAEIDSLMWKEPDSALKVMMEFTESGRADSLDEFNGHYCQVMILELLYKNYYGQSNRVELLHAVAYFDSITQVPEPVVAEHGRSVEGPSKDQIVFLSARAHYINGAGYYERDSVVAACSEYLKALEIMETYFPNLETCHGASLQPNHIPRFLCLIYSRLAELFSGQFMQEPAIACFKKAIAFNSMEPSSPTNHSSLLLLLGKQYHKLNQYDSAVCYFDEATRVLPDTNNSVFRDIVVQKALLYYNMGKDVDPSLDELKRIAAQAMNEKERLNRYMTIGGIYHAEGQYDSAWAYLMPVYESTDDALERKIAAHRLLDICQRRGDSVKANLFAPALAEVAASAYESQSCVSTLNELFQNHLKWEREKAEAERQQAEQEATRLRRMRSMVVIAAVLLVFGLGLWWWLAKRRKEHEAETQTLNEEKQQLQTQVDDALQQLQTMDDVLQQLQTQADDALQQARAMLPQRVADLYRAKVPNRLERIMDEFEAAYPKVMERLAATHPELKEAERQIAVLNFLRFRAKEEAELTGFAENTILKYRSNLNKKASSDPISALIAE